MDEGYGKLDARRGMTSEMIKEMYSRFHHERKNQHALDIERTMVGLPIFSNAGLLGALYPPPSKKQGKKAVDSKLLLLTMEN